MGAYIDDSADPSVGTSNRQYLIDCEADRGVSIILVSLTMYETNVSLDTPNGQPVGTMLEWYPYCRYKLYHGFSANPPSLSTIGAEGYVTELYLDPSAYGCHSSYGADASEANAEWQSAWNQVQGDSAAQYSDLLGQY